MKLCVNVKESYKVLFDELKAGEYPYYEDYIKICARKVYGIRTEALETWEYNKALFAYMVESEYNKRLYGDEEYVSKMKEAMIKCVNADEDLCKADEEENCQISIYVDSNYEEKFLELIKGTDNCSKVFMFKYLLLQAMFDCDSEDGETFEDRIKTIDFYTEDTFERIEEKEQQFEEYKAILEERYDYLEHLVIEKHLTFNIANYRRHGKIKTLSKVIDLIKLAEIKIQEFEKVGR